MKYVIGALVFIWLLRSRKTTLENTDVFTPAPGNVPGINEWSNSLSPNTPNQTWAATGVAPGKQAYGGYFPINSFPDYQQIWAFGNAWSPMQKQQILAAYNYGDYQPATSMFVGL